MTTFRESTEPVTEGGASGGWSWGTWGAVFNQATASVTSGLSHVIEKVETTLGIPEPSELDEAVKCTQDEKEVITTEPKSNEMDRGEEGEHDSNNPGETLLTIVICLAANYLIFSYHMYTERKTRLRPNSCVPSVPSPLTI